MMRGAQPTALQGDTRMPITKGCRKLVDEAMAQVQAAGGAQRSLHVVAR